MTARISNSDKPTAILPEPMPVIDHATEFDRRNFIKGAGGLLLAITFEIGVRGKAMAAAAGVTTTSITSFIQIGADESITIFIGGGEMGQGIYSGLAQGVAEDLMVDWSKVSVQPITASLSWITGGSTGIMRRLQTVRYAGSAARQMLLAAAAQTWGISVSACRASKGVVTNVLNSDKLTYGQLAGLAATLPVPATSSLTLVPSSAFQVIGQPVPRPDIPSKVNGSAKYGIDVTVPGMVFAVVKHCPTIGGTLTSTPAVPSGAQAVVPLYDVTGKFINAVAVVASNTWAAKNAASKLQVKWTYPATRSSISSAVFAKQSQQLLTGTAPYIVESEGNVASGMTAAVKRLNLQYNVPYLAHACMEVLNCTVRINAASVDIWAPTQAPALVQATSAALTGFPASAVNVYPSLMGGGLGHKIEQDYVGQAVQTAKAIGKPVKLTWMREEDMGHDMYRPLALSQMQIGIDANGGISAWNNRVVAPSLSLQRGRPITVKNGIGSDGVATEGSAGRPYYLPNRFIDYVPHPSPVPVGYWRSVGNSINIFAVESTIDEIALATGKDPLQLRLDLLNSSMANSTDPVFVAVVQRSIAVLNAAAALGGWGTPVTAGHARGIALSNGFGSIVAEVVEISLSSTTSIKVHSVACAVDCGYAVNPDSVIAQMQGGIIHGLNATLWGQVTFSNGTANTRNFSNYRVMRINEAPVVNVQIVNNNGPLGGIGEAAVPPVAPALANAYAKLTGKRIRSLPFFPGATMGEMGEGGGGGETATTNKTSTVVKGRIDD